MKILLTSLLCWIGLAGFAASPKHDVHVSYCQAEITARAYKGRVSYYRDDFNRALSAWHGAEVAGLSAAQMKPIYAGYMESHFRLMSGGAVIPWKWILRGDDGTSVWFELRAESASNIGDATIEHTTLFNEYNDQMNLMVLKAPDTEYNFIFTSSKPSASFTL